MLDYVANISQTGRAELDRSLDVFARRVQNAIAGIPRIRAGLSGSDGGIDVETDCRGIVRECICGQELRVQANPIRGLNLIEVEAVDDHRHLVPAIAFRQNTWQTIG